MTRTLIGLDVGTTHTKGVLIGDGRILARASREATLVSVEPSYAEMDAREWWGNCVAIVRELLAQAPAPVAAVGVSGMVPALLLLDSALHPIRPSIQQNDARTGAEIDALEASFGSERFFAATGGSINQQVLAPKLRWLAAHEPEAFARTRAICGSYDYVAYRLTGALCVEHNWALESGLLDVRSGDWGGELLALAGIDASLLPPRRASHEIVGGVTVEAAALTGLAVGTPVIAGVADHVASAFTATAADPGDLLVKFGGAGDILYALDRLTTDPRLFIDHHVVPGRYYLNGCMATSGSLVKWVSATFCGPEMAVAAAEGRSVYALMDALAAPLAPGSDGLIVLPYFLGEKTPIHDVHARGTIVGLGLHHGRAHVYRAVLEAVAYGFRHHVDVLGERGLSVGRVLASDGGAASDVWLQITADVLGRDVHRVAGHPGSSLGAAFVAGMAVGAFDDWRDIGRFVRTEAPFRPRPGAQASYDDFYALYRDTYASLRWLFPRLARARSRAIERMP